MNRIRIATSRCVFATSPFFVPVAAVPFSSLSNSLKKKKKEYAEGAEIDRKAMPRVGRGLPRVAGAAYFLGHESEGGATGFSWQMMAIKNLKNQLVTHGKQGLPPIHELFCPSPRRVALRR
ncbi:hypothetical protein [Burkholderia contaminans]|uniref:hypothetical protein n=1 Tax=Burkholderia contaminans TaxID=488447 RepID=UPI0021AB8700|nr:hypothetical protein [Burkholderia contaminans]